MTEGVAGGVAMESIAGLAAVPALAPVFAFDPASGGALDAPAQPAFAHPIAPGGLTPVSGELESSLEL